MSNLTIEQYSDSSGGFEGKTINVGDVGDTTTTTSSGDIAATIEFIEKIYNYLPELAFATLYGLAVYAAVLWITKKIKG
jgi:hypothetical protein